MRVRFRLVAAVTAMAAATVALCPSAGSPSTTSSSCAPPTKPIYVEHSVMSGAAPVQDHPSTPMDRPPIDGASLTATWGHFPSLDTDGDGTNDEVEDHSDGIAIVRGDGTVRITLGGAEHTAIHDYDARFRPGDLDGDGHDDLLVFVGSGDRGQWYAISGATAPGTYAIDDVAVRLPVQQLYPEPGQTALLGVVDDHVGGPGPDYLVRNTDGGGLVPGEALLAPGPGGTLDHFPVAIALPGEMRGEFDLGGERSALLLAEGDYVQGVIGLRIYRDGRLFDLDPFDGRGFLAYETFTAVQSPIGRLLVSKTTDRSGGTSTAVWNLDHLCGPGTPAAGAGSGAPPATPVSGDPTFTG